MRNVIKSIKTRFPPEREASLRVFFQSSTNSLRTVFSDSFVRFSFFLILTSYTPPSSFHPEGVTPPNPPFPLIRSVIRATSWPQCLWALPSSAHHILQSSLRSNLLSHGLKPELSACAAPAPELSELRNTSPPSGK